MKFPVYTDRLCVDSDNDKPVTWLRVNLEKGDAQPYYDYTADKMSDPLWVSKVTDEYLKSPRYLMDSMRFVRPRDNDSAITSYVVMVDLFHLTPVFPTWGFQEWRVLHDSSHNCVYYALIDVMMSLGYASRKSAQIVLNDICHKMPFEIKIRLLKLHWGMEGGHLTYFGDPYVVRTMLAMITMLRKNKKDGLNVKGLFTPDFLHLFLRRVVLARVSMP